MRETAQRAFARLRIPEKNRALLCLDGGGIRGIMTIQLLKELEQQAGAPCHQIFDMVAGTSTGAIIAGLVASGRTALEIEQLYGTFVTKVFTRRDMFAHQFLNPPAWSKASYRRILKETLGDVTLRDVCDKTGIDLLITAHDVTEGEETFFSYLRERPDNAYAKVLLRAVMEATMSAPTYFTPMERFVDGGTTTYNNPSVAALLEAVQYGPPQYEVGRLTIFSFGTGARTQLIAPEQVANPPGPDVTFWLDWIMTEASNDASDMQCDLLRATRVTSGCDYRRFQISLDHTAVAKLPDLPLGRIDATDANRLSELTDKELSMVKLDNVAYFPVMQAIGQGYVEFLRRHAEQSNQAVFGYDPVDASGRELLVTRAGEVARIALQMGDPAFIDGLPA
ncbi:MAG TPA: patatin-like phospholipase family protein [Polyangiaceae bacterium]|nr:patatin-like phospholipase family protein [Polyangiaceae bacterium]